MPQGGQNNQNRSFADLTDIFDPDDELQQLFHDVVPYNLLPEEESQPLLFQNNHQTRQIYQYQPNFAGQVKSEEPDQSSHQGGIPKLMLSIIPWSGHYNFKAEIKSQVDTRQKWSISSFTQKLYVGKEITFPIRVSVSPWLRNCHVVFLPVFTESQHQLAPVPRCLNCAYADPNQALRKHIVQVEGRDNLYFEQDERHMVSVPLGQPAPGEDGVTFFTKFGCRTSCVGGPNRKLFSLVLRLIHNGEEIGRQVFHLKVCQSFDRDMKADDQNYMKQHNITPEEITRMEEISSSFKAVNPSKKRKKLSPPDPPVPSSEDMMHVPKKYQERVAAYIRFLRFEELSRNHSWDYNSQ